MAKPKAGSDEPKAPPIPKVGEVLRKLDGWGPAEDGEVTDGIESGGVPLDPNANAKC
ncbi:MAG TPA: hypothetical protein VK728_00825 [Candidatus Sulfotelmatobacter sp.]|nr:hypothetical protein [Candidatus Sulfotelmatobacter sp.]